MRRLATFPLLLLAATAMAAPPGPIRDVRAPAHLVGAEPAPAPHLGKVAPECCGADDPAERMLGRAIPKKTYDVAGFFCVVGQDGKARYFPKLARSVDTSRRAAPLPQAVDWSVKAPAVLKRMYLNDRYGCCVISSRYHQIGFQTAADTGTGLEGTDDEILASYRTICGTRDRGCDMSAVNVYQQRVGLKVKGVVHKTEGSVSIDHTNQELVKSGIVVFGGLNVGLALPNEWYASKDGTDWAATNSPIVGGHEVQAFGYDDKGVWISTWGGKRRILWSAFTSKRWIDELYVTLSPDWYGSDRLAPNGIDADALKADMALVAEGKVPPLPDPVPPKPPEPTPPDPKPPVPPVPPVPPKPGEKFSGVLVYRDGALVAVVPGGTPVASGVEADLGAAKVDPQVIADVLQLIADLRAGKPVSVITNDVLRIIADLNLANEKKLKQK